MVYIRRSESRGNADFGWLRSRHSFSFGQYYDPKHMGFSVLRVINDDQVVAGAGFDTHGHRDMEIISYVSAGAMEHRDSEGNRYTIPAGEVQRMTAGSGITHSEYNASSTDPLKFIQIWIEPSEQGLQPDYEQAQIAQTEELTALVTPTGSGESLRINQDASLYRLVLPANQSYDFTSDHRLKYLHVLEGALSVEVDDQVVELKAGDALGLRLDSESQVIARDKGVTALWFDLPGVTEQVSSN